MSAPARAAAALRSLPPGSVAVVFGTRPEIVKLAGVIRLLGDRARTVYSGQHFDEQLSDVFFRDLGLPAPDLVLDVGGQRRGRQVGELVRRLDDAFAAARPLAAVVQGDTSTALGGALAANAAEVTLVHLEAGLRSFDRRMPEEHNRVVADHLADLCLAPTEHARANLVAEAVPDARIAVTGNTVVDAALGLLPPPLARRRLLAESGLEPGGFVLATFHRPENVDDGDRLGTILDQMAAVGLPVVFAVHPRTRVRMAEFGLDGAAARLRVVPPLGYRTFLGLAAESAFLVSDSGGVQEEASIVKRPVLVVRRSTERPEVIGTFATLVPVLGDIAAVAGDWRDRLEEVHERLAGIPSPYGDGRASERSVAHLLRALTPGAPFPPAGDASTGAAPSPAAR